MGSKLVYMHRIYKRYCVIMYYLEVIEHGLYKRSGYYFAMNLKDNLDIGPIFRSRSKTN